MPALLELRGLGCVRGARRLFGGLDCQVGAGGLLRVRGANGSGKTSLLRLVCGLLLPAQGEVLWRGQPPAKQADEFGRELVYIGHAAAIKDDLSALENLMLACRLGGVAPSAQQAREALQLFGLQGRERAPARQLSQGQRRRVALARLHLAAAAPLWVLDEPFNALDQAAAGSLSGLIGAHLARGGVAVLTSHQPTALDEAPGQVTVTL